jgi:hypothetical protein
MEVIGMEDAKVIEGWLKFRHCSQDDIKKSDPIYCITRLRTLTEKAELF